MNNWRKFFAEDDGAVTVDWVVLTAAVVVMAIGVFSIITRGILSEAGSNISRQIDYMVSLFLGS